MKHLKGFEEYNESSLTKFIAGAAIAGATLYGANALMNPVKKATAKYQETDLAHFPEFIVTTLGSDDNIQISVSENDGVIGSKVQHGKRKRYTITVDEGTNQVFYKFSTFGECIYATTNKSDLPSGTKIDLEELEVVEENSEYRILRVPSFWSGLDFILVNKGYSNSKNDFEINGEKYTYLEKSFGFLEGRCSFVIKNK
jgi:hypothetical protein